MNTALKLLRAVSQGIRDFLKVNIIYHSSALTYSFLLSLAPLTLVFLSLASYLPFVDPRELERILKSMFPEYTHRILSELLEVKDRAGRISAVGLIVSYIFSVNFMRTLNIAFSSVSEGTLKLKRGVTLWLILPVYLITGSIVLSISFGASLYVKIFLPSLLTRFVDVVYFIPGTALIFLLYASFFKSRKGLSRVFIVSFIVAVAISLSQILFTWYLSTLFRGNIFYGSLSTVVIFLIWINSVFALLLFGSRLIHYYKKG